MHHRAHALFEYAARGRVLFQKRRNLRFQFQKLNIQIRVNVPCVAGGSCVGARLKFFAARDGPAVKSHSTTTQYRQLRTTTLQRIFPSVLSNDYNLFNFLHIFSLGNKINRMLNSSSLSWYVLSPTVEARTWNYRAERMLKSLIAARV